MDPNEANRKRRAEGYVPQFDIDLEYGKQGELLVGDVIEAFKKQQVEVKRDGGWARTGNLYVEYQCRRFSGEWVDSGIRTSTALLWAFVLADTGTMLIIPTGTLRAFVEKVLQHGESWTKGKYKNPLMREETDGSHPTRGVITPLARENGFFDWLRCRK